jgi:predicted TIM-barrel fold metal-dependent hydrolase
MVTRPSMPRTRPQFAAPSLACDCHTHVFGPYDRFPLDAGRTYTPPEAPQEMLAGLLQRLGLERVVIVQPSVYGADNAATLDAVRRFGGRARAVAVIGDDAGAEQLAEMHAAGVRGVRLNLMMAEEPTREAATAAINRLAKAIEPYGWHIQLFATLGLIARLRETLASLPVKVVIDHFGWARQGSEADELRALCALVERGNVHVKLSAAYRLSPAGANDPDVATLARRLIAANPNALVWGSDWPHPSAFVAGRGADEPAPLHDIDDGEALNRLAEWAGDDKTLRTILVDTPARLYDFT